MITLKEIIDYVRIEMTRECFYLCDDIYCTSCNKVNWCFYNTIGIGLEYLYNGQF